MTDTVIVIPNDRLLDVAPRLPLNQAFKLADEVLMRAVKGLTELVTKPGLINLDFADVRTVMKDSGMAMIGFGEAAGQNKVVESVRKALSSPLLEVDVHDAKAALVNVSGGKDMTIEEAEGALQEVYRMMNPEARIIWGVQISPELQNKIQTLLIVTGVTSSQIYAKQAIKKQAFGIEFVDAVPTRADIGQHAVAPSEQEVKAEEQKSGMPEAPDADAGSKRSNWQVKIKSLVKKIFG